MKCDWPTCKDEALPGKKCCYLHGRVYERCIVPQPKIGIPKKSAKKEKEDKELSKLTKAMLAIDNRCELNVPGCTKIAVCLHHTKRRGKNEVLNRKYLKRSCAHCNIWVEANHGEAKEMGLLESKYK